MSGWPCKYCDFASLDPVELYEHLWRRHYVRMRLGYFRLRFNHYVLGGPRWW